jgi:nitroimidazol reductase NimA-like FMN-containing flavoprotein (pyridoxamine 5'-phosphate oxidase superfamily)
VTEPRGLDEKLLAIITGHRQGVLATIAADGRPQLSNVLYVWDDAERVARISTTRTGSKRATCAGTRGRRCRCPAIISGRTRWPT